MGKKVLWVSRFSPFEGVPRRLEALKKRFGADCEVVHCTRENASEVALAFKNGGYADLVCIVPLAALDHICREGLRPLWAEMVALQPDDPREAELEHKGKRYRFDRYRRVIGVSRKVMPVALKPGASVLRCTSNPLTGAELNALRHFFGPGMRPTEDPRLFRDGREVLERFRKSGAHELLLVAPYSVLEQVIQQGVSPIWAEFDGHEFIALRRVVGVEITFEEL